jgi:O-methyltransferase
MHLFKNMARRFLEKLGYGVYKLNTGQIFPEIISDPDCYAGPDDFSRFYRPWRSKDFSRLLHSGITENSMLPPLKLYILRQLLLSALSIEGDIFEAGAWNGGSARLMLDCLLERNIRKTMWLLDTFEGYQAVDSAKDGNHIKIADCKGKQIEDVSALLENPSVPVELIPGLIPETLDKVRCQQICFAHIDVNLHEPTAASTEFCLQRMPAGGIILFDDYGWPATYGARTAIQEVVQRNHQELICVPESTQAFLIKR